MSGQGSRARAKALRAQRLGVAKMIVQSGAALAGEGPQAILAGSMFFDVAIARAYACEVMIGPRCKDCDGVGGSEEAGDCEACDGLGYALDSHSRGRRRVAWRLIDALEGQPRECQAGCWTDGDGVSMDARSPDFYPAHCPDCHGSGHNLRGVMPPQEVTPQLRRRLREVYVYRGAGHQRCWLDEIDEHAGYGVTRVCPRGEHRQATPTEPAGQIIRLPEGVCRVRGYGRYRWAPASSMATRAPASTTAPAWREAVAWALAPRWRRGELKREALVEMRRAC